MLAHTLNSVIYFCGCIWGLF